VPYLWAISQPLNWDFFLFILTPFVIIHKKLQNNGFHCDIFMHAYATYFDGIHCIFAKLQILGPHRSSCINIQLKVSVANLELHWNSEFVDFANFPIT
jgi:hypothetical protein